jgi:hypothetical protein
LHRRFWYGNLKEGDHLEDLVNHRWENSIKMDLQEVGWNGMYWMWLRIGTSIELL